MIIMSHRMYLVPLTILPMLLNNGFGEGKEEEEEGKEVEGKEE